MVLDTELHKKNPSEHRLFSQLKRTSPSDFYKFKISDFWSMHAIISWISVAKSFMNFGIG